MKRTLSIMAACALCIPSAAYISACSPQEEERSIYTITAAYDGADTLTGSVELNYLNDTENALDCLKFNLWGNAFREGAKHPAAEGLTSSSCGGMEITEVRGGTWSVGGEDENILEVTLPQTLENIVGIFAHNLRLYAAGQPLDNQMSRTQRYVSADTPGRRLTNE